MANGTTDTIRRRLGKSFSEEAHPRDGRGRWSSGDGDWDHSSLQDDDQAKMAKIDARLDGHLGTIHEARKQVAEHVGALQKAHDTIAKAHEKAQDALQEHNDILDEYGMEITESPEIDSADELRDGLSSAVDELKPHVHGRKLK